MIEDLWKRFALFFYKLIEYLQSTIINRKSSILCFVSVYELKQQDSDRISTRPIDLIQRGYYEGRLQAYYYRILLQFLRVHGCGPGRFHALAIPT